MSAKASNANKMIKRFGKMAEGYQDKINRQSKIIDKLVAANAVYADLVYGIAEEAESLEQAKQWVQLAVDRVKEILAVPNDEENSDDETE